MPEPGAVRALVVYCHPARESFTAAVRDTVLERLAAAGAEVRLDDLHGRDFDPRMRAGEWRGYLDSPTNRAAVGREVESLLWADTLIFVYPTWWSGQPAMLKGWLDRVLLPGAAFEPGPGGGIRPALTHIRRLGVFTTCGASWWLTWAMGAPGRRTLMRGLAPLCHPRLRSVFAAHYRMDASTHESRAAHLRRVAERMDRLLV